MKHSELNQAVLLAARSALIGEVKNSRIVASKMPAAAGIRVQLRPKLGSLWGIFGLGSP